MDPMQRNSQADKAYFDPTRNKDTFKALTKGQKVVVALATAAISLITLGIGGLPMYNRLTDKFHIKNLELKHTQNVAKEPKLEEALEKRELLLNVASRLKAAFSEHLSLKDIPKDSGRDAIENDYELPPEEDFARTEATDLSDDVSAEDIHKKLTEGGHNAPVADKAKGDAGTVDRRMSNEEIASRLKGALGTYLENKEKAAKHEHPDDKHINKDFPANEIDF